MKKEWILGVLLIAGGTLHAAQTLSLTFDREKTMFAVQCRVFQQLPPDLPA